MNGPDAPAFEFDPHQCFACGSLNTHGMQLELHLEPARSWTELTLDARFEGWSGIAHGGIIATILDEVMAWALVAEENWGVTARLTIEYKRPIPVGTPIRGEGWIVRSRRRLVETEGRIVDAEGAILATARALYLAADEERKRELQARYGYRIRDLRTAAGPAPGPAVDPEVPGTAGSATPGSVARR